jgi:hypothetical protein
VRARDSEVVEPGTLDLHLVSALTEEVVAQTRELADPPDGMPVEVSRQLEGRPSILGPDAEVPIVDAETDDLVLELVEDVWIRLEGEHGGIREMLTDPTAESCLERANFQSHGGIDTADDLAERLCDPAREPLLGDPGHRSARCKESRGVQVRRGWHGPTLTFCGGPPA